MMSLWDALRMNMMISYQELVRTFPNYAPVFISLQCGQLLKLKQKRTAEAVR